MVIDWLMVWGVTQAAGLVFKPILEDLAKEAAKDYTQDFFKDGLKSYEHIWAVGSVLEMIFRKLDSLKEVPVGNWLEKYAPSSN